MPIALLLTMAAQYHGLVVVGQSLCNGPSATPVLSTSQYGGNVMLTGNAYNSTTGAMDMVPSPWPRIAHVESDQESPRWGIGKGYRDVSSADTLVMANCVGGFSYAEMAPGTEAWTNLQRGIESVCARSADAFRAAVAIHGERDHQLSTSRATYAANVAAWQQNIQAKVRAAGCGGAANVPLIVKQLSAWTSYGQATSLIHLAQYDAMKNGGGNIVIGTADYAAFPYLGIDGRHHTNVGSCAMGVKLGRVAASVVADSSWRPLYPESVTRSGAKIVVTFHVPVPPLAIDTTLVSNPGSYGFTYTDSSSPPAISSVVLCSESLDPLCVSNDAVLVTLASTPTGSNKLIRYAYSGTGGAFGGPTTGPRGNLRDSSAESVTCDATNVPLYNWAVHFEEAVP